MKLTGNTPANNTATIKQPVQGSFDPNDKQCLEGNKIATSELGNNLHYQIRFQNEGTDTAFNVTIADTLSAKYDESSFQLLSSSHPCIIKRKGNIIHFEFANIQLPYKTINEPASHGYVSFVVKPKNTLISGDSLNNRASIYFDFNLPIVTNKAATVVTAPSVLSVKTEYLNGEINNTGNKLNWKITCTAVQYVTMSVQRSNDGVNFEDIGNISATAVRCQQPFNFTDEKITAAKNYYRIKITEDNGAVYYTSIILLQQKTDGIIITKINAEKNYLSLTINSIQKNNLTLYATTADGRQLLQKTLTVARGTSVINMPINMLANGLYFFTIKGNGIFHTSKHFISNNF